MMKIVAFCYCLKFIKKTFRRAEDSNKVREDWKYVAMVLDRLFLWIFTIAVIGKILSFYTDTDNGCLQ